MARKPRDAQRAKTTYPFRRRQPIEIPTETITETTTETIVIRQNLGGGGYHIGFLTGSTFLTGAMPRTLWEGEKVRNDVLHIAPHPNAGFLRGLTSDDIFSFTFSTTATY